MIRAAILFLLLIGASYGVLWLATSTPYFKDKARVRSIIKKIALGASSIVIAVAIFGSIFFIEHQI